MTTQKLYAGITYFGANDNQLERFEALWKIPQGVSYNCYLIQDKKTALIDTVDDRFGPELLSELKKLLGDKSLDFLILNHMEPDHSGTLKQIIKQFPRVQIVGNHKTASFVQGFYNIAEDKVKQIKTGDKLALGTHQLEFIQTPMVHWPESMVTYDHHSKILFSSDFFGGYKTVDDQPLADKNSNLDEFIDEAREYFATVLGAHTRPAKRVFKQLDKLEIDMIAPAHGLVWQETKDKIYHLYQQWNNYEAESGVCLVYGSMYGHTQKIAEKLAQQLTKQKIKTEILNAAQAELSELLNSVWKYQGLVIGSCTYNNDIFPPVRNLLQALEDRTLQKRYFGYFGSYSWTGGAGKRLEEFMEKTKLETVEPHFRVQYSLNEEVEEKVDELAKNIVERLQQTQA